MPPPTGTTPAFPAAADASADAETADGLMRAPGGGRPPRLVGRGPEATDRRPLLPTVAIESGVGVSGGELWRCSQRACRHEQAFSSSFAVRLAFARAHDGPPEAQAGPIVVVCNHAQHLRLQSRSLHSNREA